VEDSVTALHRDEIEAHLARIMIAACGDAEAGSQLEDLEDGVEGTIQITGFGGGHPTAMVSERLILPEMEATTLHEAGHWMQGHLVGLPQDGNYQGAVIADLANRTATRGPWEQEADSRALKLLADDTVRSTIETAPEELERLLIEDARKYGPFEATSRQ
jgi:hypothetical protein